jgi:hypothetical protein
MFAILFLFTIWPAIHVFRDNTLHDITSDFKQMNMILKIPQPVYVNEQSDEIVI